MTQVEIEQSEWAPRDSRRRLAAKRILDVIGASFGLLFFAPVILSVALAILVMDGRPVIYSHRRIGRSGRLFGCLKFRTMARNGDAVLAAHLAHDPLARHEWETTRKLERDPRVGCFGRLLRRSSVDELPQFWNVLRGEMSLVGPRPIVEDERHHYGHHIAAYQAVRPGLTGAWQVSGRSDTTYEERVALDVTYVRERSTTLDLRIILRTVLVLLTARGAR